jgi:hypothetical protein
MAQYISGSGLSLLRRWRRVVAAARHDGCGLAALAFQSFEPADQLVPLESISAVVLAIEPTEFGATHIRFSIYGASAIPFGVQWGSAGNCRLSKNLRLRPRMKAKGRRFDLTHVRLLHSAIDLFEAILHAEVHDVGDHLQLPQVWAGFDPTAGIEGDGPELAGLVHQMGVTSAELMFRCRRSHQSLVCYPLEFVSDRWQEARLFVDVGSVPSIQIVQCEQSEEALDGFRGAAVFDFVTDVFRPPLVYVDRESGSYAREQTPDGESDLNGRC